MKLCAFHSDVGRPELGGEGRRGETPYCEGEQCLLGLVLITTFKTAKHHD